MNKSVLIVLLTTALFSGLVLAGFVRVSATSTVSASIQKPSVPEFTVEFDNESKTVVLKIKNQPFESYYDPGRGLTIQLYYNIRYKSSGDWAEVYRPSDFYLNPDSGSEYTTESFDASNGITFRTENRIITVHSDEIDFQVEAMIGAVHRQDTGSMIVPWVFSGEKSGWSETVTVTISTSTQPPSTSSTTEPESTEPEPTESTHAESAETLFTITEVILIVAVAVSITIGIVNFWILRKRKT